MCKGCVTRHVLEEINGKGNVVSITCPHNECAKLLEHVDIQYFLSQPDFARFDTLCLRRMLQSLDEFRWCAHPGCGSGQLTEGGVDVANFMRCTGCRRTTCLRHHCPMHEGMSCDEYDQEACQSEEVALHQYLESDSVVRCIKCGQGIEKNGGCDHMTCKREVGGCGAEFCWRCGADYNGPNGIRAIGNTAHSRSCTWYA